MMMLHRARNTWTLLVDAVMLWSARYAFQHAGALAFYTLFSLAPLTIIIVAITGAVFGEEAARGEISGQIEGLIGAQAAEAVEEAVRRSRVEEAGLLPTIIGAGALLFGATTVFAQMQSSLNQFWGVAAKPSRSGFIVFITTRLLSLGLVLIIGFLLLTSLVISMSLAVVIQFAEHWIPIPPLAVLGIDLVASLGIATLLFATIFKVLPDVRLEWRDMWQAGFITAILFVTGQYLISIYFTQAAPASTYGAAGSLVIVLLWVYYSSLILFFGAAFTKVRIRARGGRIVPKAGAVRVVLEIMEEDEAGDRKKVETAD
jgi:membrane protein